jgi:DUF1365 family protein
MIKKLFDASVIHKRLKPSINQFNYRIFYICFDITKIQNLRSKIFSLNRFNLFSFYQKDHGNKDGSSLESWIRKILKAENLAEKTKKIFLFTHPRILGFAFNPVSFWFCLDEEKKLIAVLAQVNNTFGETHCYLVFNPNHSPIEQNQWLEAKKEFHVSPFFAVEGFYKFRFIFSENKIAAFIDYFTNEKSLLTSVTASSHEMTNLNLVWFFFKIPTMIIKVIFLIHWQALKLLFKKNKYFPKPPQFLHRITKTK